MKLVSLLLLFTALSLNTLAQNNCPCCTENHQQFDFWVGHWTVSDTNGTILGENRIEKLEQGCILNEHWTGAKGSTGKSYNYYDSTTSTWNQLSIDAQGSNLKLKGSLVDNKMILRSEAQKGKSGTYYNQITWTNNSNGTVTQQWDILDGELNVSKTVFLGIYKRK